MKFLAVLAFALILTAACGSTDSPSETVPPNTGSPVGSIDEGAPSD